MIDKKFGHPLFYKLLDAMAELHSRKNHDYAGESDPLKNLRRSLAIGIDPFTGVMVRLQDKWSRLEQFMKSGIMQVKDESVEDTLMDNAVYSLLAIILRREGKLQEAFSTGVKSDGLEPAGPRLVKDEPVQIIGPVQPVEEELLVIKAIKKSSYSGEQKDKIIAEIREIARTPDWNPGGKTIQSCFTWSNTPQGATYWDKINNLLYDEGCYA